MSVRITETPPKDDCIPKTGFRFTCDEVDKRVPKPLPQTLNFFLTICGKSGMGKSTLLMNLICRRKSPYRKKFDKVYLWSPSLDTLEKNPFDCLPQEQVFDELTYENLQGVVDDISGTGDKVLLIMDDVNNAIKDDKQLEVLFTTVSHNRRHLAGKGGSVSVILTCQVYNKIPMPIRKNNSHLITFRPPKMDLELVFNEHILLSKKDWEAVVRYTFQEARDWLYIDLKEGVFYRNWNRLELQNGG
jgi:hypothetical protein